MHMVRTRDIKYTHYTIHSSLHKNNTKTHLFAVLEVGQSK